MIDDAVAIEKCGGPRRGAGDSTPLIFAKPRPGSGAARSRRRFHGRQRGRIAGSPACRRSALPTDGRTATFMFALAAGIAGRSKPALPGRASRRQNVRRTPRGRQRQQHVTALAESLDLPREHLFETIIVGDGCQHRGVGGQRDRGAGGPVLFIAADDLGGDMLCIGGAAAIADDQELVARAQRRDSNRCCCCSTGRC